MELSTTLRQLFANIAGAIREKLGTADSIQAGDFPDRIRDIEVGINTDDATANAGDILSPKTAYAKGEKLTGTIPTRSTDALSVLGATVSVPAGYYPSDASKAISTAPQATPSISVNAAGVITASATQSTGYVPSGTKSATHTLSESDDADFVPENIVEGKTIFGKTGTAKIGDDTSDANAVAGDIRKDKTAYVNGRKITGSLAEVVHPNPTASIENSTGKVTASHKQDSGIVVGSTATETLNLTTQEAQTIVPGVKDVVIAAFRWLTGKITVKGDENLIPGNIAKGKSIFGVEGDADTGGIDTDDATALATDIRKDKTAYVKGNKVTGSLAEVEHPKPVIAMASSATGEIIASHAQEGGIVDGGTTTGVLQLATQAEQIITPGVKDVVIAAFRWLTGKITVKGDENLVSENIIQGKSIFGVDGTASGLDTSDADAVADDILADKTAYVDGKKITGTMPPVEHPDPSVSINSATGLVTASHTQSTGRVTGGTTSKTLELTTKAAATITPGTKEQSIAARTYLTGKQTIEGSSNLVPENIVKDVTIFGVKGTAQIGDDTSDATATEDDILLGKTAYVKGEKISGLIQTKNENDIAIDTENKKFLVPVGYFDEIAEVDIPDVSEKVAIDDPAISVSNAGLITAKVTQTNTGRIDSGDVAQSTHQLTVQGAQTITPGTDSKEIASGTYLTGKQTIKGDANLVPENIITGKSIFGVDGTASGLDTSDATATNNDILSGKTAYAKGEKLTGNIPTKSASDMTASGATVTAPAGYYASAASKSVASATQATPSISVDDAGKITASATQDAGYVAAGTKSATKQLDTQGAQTITPGAADQTIPAGKYLTGAQTIQGDANLIEANIIEGKSIFGVPGRAKTGIDTSDATATSNDILEDKTAYANGQKITGNIKIRKASDISQSYNNVFVLGGYYPAPVVSTIPEVDQAVPEIIFANSSGKITVSAHQVEGYVYPGSKRVTEQLATLAEQTITPGTKNQKIARYQWLTGVQTILGDANLLAKNIKYGVTIFGVTGTFGKQSVITVSASPETGGSVSGGGLYDDGESITLSASPFDTYRFVSWMAGGRIISSDSIFSLVVNGSEEYIAVFSHTISDGFIQVEYIQSNGSQYIDTGIIFNDYTSVTIDFETLSDATSDSKYLMGSQYSQGPCSFYFNSNGYGAQRGTLYRMLSYTGTAVGRHTVNYNGVYSDWNGAVLVDRMVNYGLGVSVTGSNSIYLFACHGQPISDAITARIYSCSITQSRNDDGDYVGINIDLIPCVRVSDQMAGLYDAQNNVFYPSKTGVSFTAGPVVQ